MGNSLRHSLGHMCGGEAAKERPEDDGEKPVDRPKESKKKSKKHKKHKKVRNGKLGSIKEENELQPNGNSKLPIGGEKTGESVNTYESQKHEDTPIVDPPQLEPATEDSKKDELHINDETSNLPVIRVDCPSDTISVEEDEKTIDEVSSDTPVSDSCLNSEDTNVDGEVKEISDGDNISLISTEEAPSIMVCTFKPISTEILGIEDADTLFQKAFIHYQQYADGGNNFKDSILKFQLSVQPEKKSIDFLTLWHVYKAQAEETIRAENKFDLSSDLKAMESTGLELIQIIENLKPVLSQCTEDANNINAIECAKDQMLEGDELMTTDKFSAPGKYRRNMSRLRKCMKHVIEIELETNEILRCLQVFFNEHKDHLYEIDSKSLARESIIIPEQKNTNHDLEEIFSNLSQESIPLAVSDGDDKSLSDENGDRPSTPLPTIDVQVSPDQLSYEAYESHSDRDGDDVFVDVQYVSDDDCLESIQVSKEISNCMGLDFDIISPNIQVIENEADDADEIKTESHALPQVHFNDTHDDDESTVEIYATCEEIVVAEHPQINLKCTPDIPEAAPIAFPSEIDNDLDELCLGEIRSSSINSINVELDCSPDNQVGSINVECQSPPLSENIIGSPVSDRVTISPISVVDDHCDELELSTEDKNNLEEKLDGMTGTISDTNISNFVEIVNPGIASPELSMSIEVVFEESEITYEQIEYEGSHPSSSDSELENLNNSMKGSNENAEPSDNELSDQLVTNRLVDTDTSRKDICLSRLDSAHVSVEHDSSPDHIDVYEYNASTPLTETFPSTPYCIPDKIDIGIISSDDESDRDKDKAYEKIFLDSCEEITEAEIGKDTTVITLHNMSSVSPVTNISNANLALEEIHNNDISDSECNSDTTSIQEIQIFPTNRSFKYKDSNANAEPIPCNEPPLSPKGLSDTSTEVDVALQALQVAINDNDVQDEYVDLLCSSISRVLGDDEEKPQYTKLKSVESSHSSHDETSLHKSFTLSKEVLDWVGTHFQNDEQENCNDKLSGDEREQCIIVPVEKGSVHSPHIISHTIIKPEKHPMKSGDLVKTVNVSVEDITAENPTDDLPDDDLDVTFVIKSVPETSESNDILPPLSSYPKRICHTPPLELDMEPDHNTLDYGNYVFIDPSTGDIQVMRNRSRSLDSLVSMASSRSSISRFGSFEFVTDFEINIAEKNQEMMKGH